MVDDVRKLLVESFRWVADAGTTSSGADRTGWLRNPIIAGRIGAVLADLVPGADATVVVGPESSGLPLGALVAHHLSTGFVAAGKKRRSLADSDDWLSALTPLDYQGRIMELTLRRRLLAAGDRVLLVDDWADTGGQLLALHALVRDAGARVAGTVVIVDGLKDHAVRRTLDLRSVLNVRELRAR